jgi:hypothetical protein
MNSRVVVAEIDPAELAVRIGEALMNAHRRPGVTAVRILDETNPEMRDKLVRAAKAAAEYIAECVDGGRLMQ